MARYKRVDLLTIALFCAVVAALFLAEPPTSWRSVQHFWNLGHVVLFFLCSRVVILLFPAINGWKTGRRLTLLLSLSLILGSTIEFYQLYVPGRDASLADLAADLAGPLLYLGLWNTARGHIRMVMLISAAFLSSFSILPGLAALSDEIIAIQQFPLLADFETPFEGSRFTGDAKFLISDRHAFSGHKSLLMRLNTSQYSGVNLKYFKGDWSAFKTFNCAVFNPNRKPVKLNLRIHDLLHEQGTMEYSDRFNTAFRLMPGWNRLQVSLADVRNAPRSREMDMRTIKGVGFFVAHERKPLTLYLDTLKLEK